jgi:hypothetical protein
VKLRWLGALAFYLAASVGVLFVPWPESVARGGDAGSDWELLRILALGGSWVEAVRLGWMIPILAASALVWLSARREIRPAHAELSLALALGAIAYPFVSFPEPGCPSLWVGSSAAAFVVTYAGVLGWKALSCHRGEFLAAPRGSTPLL